MGKVTACKMDVVTKKSGHTMTGCAVSVCITPAAPSPIPIPYPTVGTVAEGITDPCMRTKIGGAIVMTVGSCMAKCHGNEPGTLKEVVSLNTAGPCFPILGAPMVFMELGMAGITTSPGQMNKSITVGASGSASGAGGGGSGAGGGAGGGAAPPGANTQGPGGGGGSGGGSNDGAGPPSPPAPPGAEGQAAAGHPVDVVTGTLFAQAKDFSLLGLFPIHFLRQYFSSGVREACGLGWGWTHPLAWRGRKRGDAFELVDDRNARTRFSLPSGGELLGLPFGRTLRTEGDEIVVEGSDGLVRVLRPTGVGGAYRLAELRDRFGASARITWDGAEVVEIVDTVGRRATLAREGPFRVWTHFVIDAEGVEHRRRLVTYEIDERGDLVQVIDAGGTETRYAYDADHYLVAETQPDGLVYHFVYADVAGERRCVETWGELPGLDVLALIGRPDGEGPRPRGLFHTRLEYDPARRITRVIDGEGGHHVYEGNALGLVERYVDPVGAATRLRYDERGQLVSVSDPTGAVERRQHGPDGRPRAFIAPDGSAVRYRYDDAMGEVETLAPEGFRARQRVRDGLIVELEDAAGRVIGADYDARGLNTAVRYPDGASDALEYDAHGNIVAYARGEAVTRYEWDMFGMPLAITSPGGATMRFGYDSYGNVARIVSPTGQVVEHEVDHAQRILATSFPGGGTASYRWVAGTLVEQTHPDGATWKLGWDALRRLRWVENPAGERHRVDYDAAGRIRRIISFTGLVSYYDYDGNGRMTRVVRPDESTTRYLRDPAGRIVAREHSSGVVEQVEYDRFGRIASVSNGVTRVELDYAVDGLLRRERQICGGHEFAVDYDYDEHGQLRGRRYSTGWRVATSTNSRGAAISYTIAEGDELTEVTVERDLDDREVRRGFPGGPVAAMDRNALGHLTRVAIADAEGEVLRSREWVWSHVGPVATVSDSRRGDRHYEVDLVGRPLAARGLGTAERFDYAPQGTPKDESMQTGVGGRPTQVGDTALSWDRRGRLVERRGPTPRDSYTYAYDHNDQIVEVCRGDGLEVRYVYDPLGRRLAEIVGDRSTWFCWDGDTLVEERPTAGRRVRRVFDRDGHTPLVEIDDGGARLVITDSAATPWALVDAEATISDLELDAWGTVCFTSGAQTGLRFAGQRHDEATGLHYNRFRYYAPDLHVFTTPDPLGLAASVQEIGFVRNATFFVDPLGLLTIITASPDPKLHASYYSRYQAMYPGATILTPSQVTPGSLAGETDVVVDTHGVPGQVQWGNQWLTGAQLADQLKGAGFNGGKGSRVEVIACNSATKPGVFGRSVAQAVADRTGATTSGAAAAGVPGVANATAMGNAGASGLLRGMPTGLGTGSAPGNMHVDGGGSYLTDIEPRGYTLGF